MWAAASGQAWPSAAGPQYPPAGSGPPPQGPPEDSRKADRSRSRSDGRRSLRFPAIPTWSDDNAKLSTAYKMLGSSHLSVKNTSTPKKFRMQLICSCNSDLWPMATISQLGEEEVDFLLFIATGISPRTRPGDLGVRTKGEAMKTVAQQYRAKMRRNPSRLNMLSEELDNLGLTAMKMGYDVRWLSDELRSAWDGRGGNGMQGAYGISDIHRAGCASAGSQPGNGAPQSTTPQKSSARGPKALEDQDRQPTPSPSPPVTRRESESKGFVPGFCGKPGGSPPAGARKAPDEIDEQHPVVSRAMPALKLPQFSQRSDEMPIGANPKEAKARQASARQSGRHGTEPGHVAAAEVGDVDPPEDISSQADDGPMNPAPHTPR